MNEPSTQPRELSPDTILEVPAPQALATTWPDLAQPFAGPLPSVGAARLGPGRGGALTRAGLELEFFRKLS